MNERKLYKPNQLAHLTVDISKRRRVVEIMSYPIPNDTGIGRENFTIMVRMVPGDPTTLREVQVADLVISDHTAGIPYLGEVYRYIHIGFVHCHGMQFPEDMLRYDCCALVDPDQQESPVDGYRPVCPAVYRVTTTRRVPWTVHRWASCSTPINHHKTFDLQASEPFTVVGNTHEQ